MNVAAELAEGIAERVVTRVRAADRLDALDEQSSAPTFAQTLESDPGRLAALVEEALDEVLGCLADPGARAALRALARGDSAEVPEGMRRCGLVVSSWSGDEDRLGTAGAALAALLDSAAGGAAEIAGRRLGLAGGRT